MGRLPNLPSLPNFRTLCASDGLSHLTTFTVDGAAKTNGATVNLANGVTSVTIAATDGGSITTGPAGNTGLSTGDNSCTFTITSEDGVTTLAVTINLHVLLPAPSLIDVSLDVGGGTEPTVGQVCTANPGTQTNCTSFTYIWKADGVAIPSATLSTYTPTRADAMGKALTCTVVGVNETGNTAPVTSNATSATTGAPLNTAAPVATSSGTTPALVGDTVTTTDGTWTGYPAPTFTYANNATNGGTNNSVAAHLLDIGTAAIVFTVTATNSVGAVDADSNKVAVVA